MSTPPVVGNRANDSEMPSVGDVMTAVVKPALDQAQQDNIWKHFQNHAQESFDLSYPRLRYLAERCSTGARVLNIGAGSGGLEKLMTERGVEVYSLDPSTETIVRLQAEFDLGERAKQGYSQAIPFDDGYFDKVIMTEVLEHLSDDILRATLDEVRRVLKIGGEFTGTVPYRENLQDSVVACPYCESRFHRWGHQQSFNSETLGQLMRLHGFQVKKLLPRSFPDFRRPGVKLFLKSVFRYVLGRMGEPLVGPNLYFVVRKTA